MKQVRIATEVLPETLEALLNGSMTFESLMPQNKSL